MKEVFRLCKAQFAQLDGEGARLYGGRWNSPGNAVVYTSATLALAVLENLVHVDPDDMPTGLVSLRIQIPEDASFELFPEKIPPPESIAASIGDDWIRRNEALLFFVPSAVVPERNILINPKHPQMIKVKVVDQADFSFDPRLLKGSS